MKIFVGMNVLAAVLMVPPAWAGSNDSPVGLWQNIDDVTGKPKALIRISERDGELQGKLEKLFLEPDDDPHPVCERCEGVLKNQPVLGMVFMKGLKKDGDAYSGGQILDPDNGKIYKSQLTLIDQGRRLEVRGYIGVPLFGRSQIWLRQEAPK